MGKCIRSIFLVVMFCSLSNFNIAYAFETGSAATAEKEPEEVVIVYPPFTGLKKTIAVTKFENRVSGQVGDGMADMLTTELIKSGRFIVVERLDLDDVKREQNISTKKGQLMGAQILIRGSVTAFDQSQSKGGGFGFMGLSVGSTTSKATVGLDIRIIDPSSGQVLNSHSSVGNIESSSTSVGFSIAGISMGKDGFEKTPIGQATRQAIHDAVNFISEKLDSVPFSAKIIKVADNKIYINAGKAANINVGNKFNVYSLSEALVDPDTGLSLGADEKLIGTIEVQDVQDKYSIGNSTINQSIIMAGNIIRPM
jgi:curli biogenesis system outer membrane secretion channel CsgG